MLSHQHAAADALAQSLHQAQPTPALSIAVADAGDVLWSAALGLSDLEFDVPAASEHSYRIGSVSKAVTATIAARLALRGTVALDTPIANYLPDLPETHRATTLRQLLVHQGGVRHYGPKDLARDAPGGPIVQRAFPDRASILALFIDDPLVAPVGAQVSYSSFGYSLASFVLEEAAGTGFLDLVAEEIARPFSLPSLAADDVLAVIPGRTSGYLTARELEFLDQRMPGWGPRPREDGGPVRANFSSPAFCWAGAGLLMTMPDLARFGAAHLDSPHSRVTPQERDLLFTPLTEQTAASPPLGLGWRVDRDAKDRLRWHHAGSTPGGRASLVVYPDAGLSIALSSNAMMTPGDVLGPSAELADLFA